MVEQVVLPVLLEVQVLIQMVDLVVVVVGVVVAVLPDLVELTDMQVVLPTSVTPRLELVVAVEQVEQVESDHKRLVE